MMQNVIQALTAGSLCIALPGAAGPANCVCNGDINVWHCAPYIGPFVAIPQWRRRSYLLKAVSL